MYATGETYPVTAVHLDLMALTKDRQPPLTYNFSFEAGNNFSFEADKCINLVKNA